MDKPLKIKKRRASLDARKARSGYMFVAPFIIGIVLIYLPILIDSIWFSLTNIDRSGLTGVDEVYVYQGFKYYVDAFSDSEFTGVLLDGLSEVIFQVPAIIIFSLFIAVVLNQKMLGRAAFRAIFFVPVILSTGLMESLNAQTQAATDAAQGGIQDGAGEGAGSGIISIMDVQGLFESIQIAQPIVEYVVKIVNDVYNIINYSGVQMLIFLAGLQSISPAIYEASQIEGATGWETFWKITFPMISPMILVNAVYTVIDSFTRSTNPAMSWIAGLYNGDPHKATAMSWMYFIVVMLIILVVAAIASSFIFYQRRD